MASARRSAPQNNTHQNIQSIQYYCILLYILFILIRNRERELREIFICHWRTERVGQSKKKGQKKEKKRNKKRKDKERICQPVRYFFVLFSSYHYLFFRPMLRANSIHYFVLFERERDLYLETRVHRLFACVERGKTQ